MRWTGLASDRDSPALIMRKDISTPTSVVRGRCTQSKVKNAPWQSNDNDRRESQSHRLAGGTGVRQHAFECRLGQEKATGGTHALQRKPEIHVEYHALQR